MFLKGNLLIQCEVHFQPKNPKHHVKKNSLATLDSNTLGILSTRYSAQCLDFNSKFKRKEFYSLSKSSRSLLLKTLVV